VDWLLQREAILKVLIESALAIALALLAWVSGAGKWFAGHFDRWLERRRRMNPQHPRTTMKVVADLSMQPPLWGKHNFGNGRTATSCSAFLAITKLLPLSGVRVMYATVRLRGRYRFGRKAHSINFARLDGGDQSFGVWQISFYVLPEVATGDIRADVTVYDQLGNAHRTKVLRFKSRPSDALPW
jgi:hypothetical protein